MSKFVKAFLTLISLTFLVACSNGQSTTKQSSSSSSDSAKVELIVKEDQETKTSTVTVSDDETVMDVLKDTYEVKEDDGFITEIDGIAQDESAGKYWMFKVNDEVAPKAADQITVKDGDKIEFYQEVFE